MVATALGVAKGQGEATGMLVMSQQSQQVSGRSRWRTNACRRVMGAGSAVAEDDDNGDGDRAPACIATNL
jgi:hypothetical protein